MANRWVAVLLVIVAGLLLGAQLSFWAWRTFLDKPTFIAETSAALSEPEVARSNAAWVVGDLLGDERFVPRLVRDLAEEQVADSLSSPRSKGLHDRVAADLYAVLFEGVDEDVRLEVIRLKDIVAAIVRPISAGAAARIDGEPDGLLLADADNLPDLQIVAEASPPVLIGCTLLAALLAALCVGFARDRRWALRGLGVALGVPAVIAAALVPLLRGYSTEGLTTPEGNLLLERLIDVFSADLAVQSGVLIVTGVIVFILGWVPLPGRGARR